MRKALKNKNGRAKTTVSKLNKALTFRSKPCFLSQIKSISRSAVYDKALEVNVTFCSVVGNIETEAGEVAFPIAG